MAPSASSSTRPAAPRTDYTFRLLCLVITVSALGQAYLFASYGRGRGGGAPGRSPAQAAHALDPHQAAEAARQEHAALLAEAAGTPPATRARLAAALALLPAAPLPLELQAPAWRLAALQRLQPLAAPAVPGLRPWLVYMASAWFSERTHKWAAEERLYSCPSGCSIAFYAAAHRPLWQRADLALYFPGPGAGERLVPPLQQQQQQQDPALARNATTVHALFYAENFAPIFSAGHVAKFDAHASYRSGSLWRDDEYVYAAAGSAGLLAPPPPPAPPAPDFASLTWADLFPPPPPLPPARPRLTLRPPSPDRAILSWATTHCASRSGREELVAALEALGMPLDIYGPPGASCCLCAPWRHTRDSAAPALLAESAAGPPFPAQEAHLARYPFHLAAENTLCSDYVTEKAYGALARGAVPVLLSAPNARAWLPPRSFIDATRFPSVRALAAHLAALDANASALAELHEWRRRPFGQWPAGQGSQVLRVVRWLLPWRAWQRSGSSDGSSAGSARGSGPEDWYACSLCDALEEGAGGAGGAGWEERSAALYAGVRRASAAPRLGPQACAGFISVADDADGTLRVSSAAAEFQPPHRPTDLPWLRRALRARDEEKRALLAEKRRRLRRGEGGGEGGGGGWGG